MNCGLVEKTFCSQALRTYSVADWTCMGSDNQVYDVSLPCQEPPSYANVGIALSFSTKVYNNGHLLSFKLYACSSQFFIRWSLRS